MKTRAGILLAIGALALVTAAACGSSGDNKTVQANLDLAPISALAASAAADAQAMSQHADAMTAAAARRPDQARWAADAETIRANARTLSFLADAARAIGRDPGARPTNAVELTRVYGDGANLHQLGELLVTHAQAMEQHVTVMRGEAAGDAELQSAVETLASMLNGMKTDGQNASERGLQLMEEARALARTVGVTLPAEADHSAP